MKNRRDRRISAGKRLTGLLGASVMFVTAVFGGVVPAQETLVSDELAETVEAGYELEEQVGPASEVVLAGLEDGLATEEDEDSAGVFAAEEVGTAELSEEFQSSEEDDFGDDLLIDGIDIDTDDFVSEDAAATEDYLIDAEGDTADLLVQDPEDYDGDLILPDGLGEDGDESFLSGDSEEEFSALYNEGSAEEGTDSSLLLDDESDEDGDLLTSAGAAAGESEDDSDASESENEASIILGSSDLKDDDELQEDAEEEVEEWEEEEVDVEGSDPTVVPDDAGTSVPVLKNGRRLLAASGTAGTTDAFSTYGAQLDSDSKAIYDAMVDCYITRGLRGYTVETDGEVKPQDSPLSGKDGNGPTYEYYEFRVTYSLEDAKKLGYYGPEITEELAARFKYMTQAAVDAFSYDHPELFWYRPQGYTLLYGKTTLGNRFLSGINLKMSETFSGAYGLRGTFADALSKKTGENGEILKGADYDGDGDISEWEKVQAAHDYLIRRMWYDSTSLANYTSTQDYRIFTAAGALVDSVGTGIVCEGYSKAMKVLLGQMGIDACLIRGMVGSEGHMWNGILIEGNWYLLDLTWDDRGSSPNTDVYYKYYLVSSISGRTTSGRFSQETVSSQTFLYPVIRSMDAHSFSLMTDGANYDFCTSFCEYRCADDSVHYWLPPNGHTWDEYEICTVCEISKEEWDANGGDTWNNYPDGYDDDDIINHTGGVDNYSPVVDNNNEDDETSEKTGGDENSGSDSNSGSGSSTSGGGSTSSETESVTPTAAVSLSSAKITVKDVTYTGSALKPAPTVVLGGKTLKNGTDYTVSYKNNTKAGTATVIVTGKGSYKGTAQTTFTIKKRSAAAFTVKVKDVTYNGKARKPSVKVKYGSTVLKKGTDYTLAYANNKNAGKATVTVKGKGNFSKSQKVTFRIKKASIASVTVNGVPKKTAWTGKKIKPVPELILGTMKLKSGRDYSVSWSANKAVGTAKITLKGKGNFTGKRVETFRITPGKVKGVTLKRTASGAIKVTWKKANQAGGYQVAASTQKDFSTKKKWTVKKSKREKTITSYSSDPVVYVRVRAWKKVNGKKIYGTWSAIKKSQLKLAE